MGFLFVCPPVNRTTQKCCKLDGRDSEYGFIVSILDGHQNLNKFRPLAALLAQDILRYLHDIAMIFRMPHNIVKISCEYCWASCSNRATFCRSVYWCECEHITKKCNYLHG
ncbi:hypothetical protein AVEN_240895-1 [Araneus ventricosus]|uniref:Uncharacterized protein n=1 Tax=Araneus ventricosus TaxID=182803 RepID=A0A4Y2R0C2_ARAVE|nr:hypothetical protein AVEN_240895-1 [Araneus ventricosus]